MMVHIVWREVSLRGYQEQFFNSTTREKHTQLGVAFESTLELSGAHFSRRMLVHTAHDENGSEPN